MANQIKKILIVDDFETIRVILACCLENLGITDLVQAEDGSEALQLMQEAQEKNAPFDLVFCDWNMPVMSGFDLLVKIRKMESFQKLPFVMITANSEESAVVAAMQAGVSDYIIKPFDAGNLSRSVTKVIGRFQSEAA